MTEPPAPAAADDERPPDRDTLLREVVAALRWARHGGAQAVPRDPAAVPPAAEPSLRPPTPARRSRPRELAPVPSIAAHAVGPRDARLLVVVAGREQDTAGACWHGPDGELLARMIRAMGLRPADIYAVTLVPDDAPETEALSAQLRAVQPAAMLVLGERAARWMLRSRAPIDELRGRWRRLAAVPTMITYGPARLLDTPRLKRAAWADLQEVMAKLGGG